MTTDLATRLVRPALRGYQPYVPGTGVEEAMRKYGLTSVVKLSQNENPLGTSPRALAAVRSIDDFSAYVPDDYLELRGMLAARYARRGIGTQHVILGHGSNELVALLFTAFVDPDDEVVTAVPTFSLYAKYSKIAGARTIEVPLRDGVHDLAAMRSAITARTKLVFICDPNNPTGTRVERSEMLAFARDLPSDVLLVIDQAYGEYMDADALDAVDLPAEHPNTIVLRTSSKILGLAALRFGYAYAGEDVISWLLRVRLPFNVGRPALEAVRAALGDDDFVRRSIALNDAGKEQLYAAFGRLGLFAYPTAANFVAVQVPVAANTAYEALMKRGVIVRSGDGLRLPNFLRVTIGTQAQNAAFIDALEAELKLWR